MLFEDALRQQHDSTLEALINALLLLPLSTHTLTRIQLGNSFRHSLQSSRVTTPYRLHTVISECKAGTVEKTCLEAKFFVHGGARAVSAFATAAADDKRIVGLLNGLPDTQLQAFLNSINTIPPHRDFLFMVETLDRRKPSRLSKRRCIPGPRHRPRRHRQAQTMGITRTRAQQHAHSSEQELCLTRTETGSLESDVIAKGQTDVSLAALDSE